MAVFEPSHPPAPFWCQSHLPFHFNSTANVANRPPSPFYDVPLFFMAGPRANNRANPLSAQPPRPPNAWILYRSDKLKDLPQPEPGQPRRPQADISKTISSMWKAELPDVRAHYERLSDIKKAEHQAQYPGYRFQPMKKADKDRLRAEKQAERERERGARRSKARARVSASNADQPLYTTEARPGATNDATPGPSSAPATAPHPTPPPQHPTPPPTEPASPAVEPALYPAPPAQTHAPPLAAPQPGVPQRPPSVPAEEYAGYDARQSEFDALWLDQGIPDFGEYQQEYLTVPLPNSTSQFPLGWSPDDPSPPTDMPFFQPQALSQSQEQPQQHQQQQPHHSQSQFLPPSHFHHSHDQQQQNPQPASLNPLHATLSLTDDPYTFSLLDFDASQLFDDNGGARALEVSMGANMLPNAFVDMGGFGGGSSWLFEGLGEGQGEGSGLGLQGLEEYTFENPIGEGERPVFDDPEFGGVTPTTSSGPSSAQEPAHEEQQQQQQAPYVPPAGAANSSTRRVAADWRHVRLTPESC